MINMTQAIDSGLHDYEILKINVNYDEAIITLYFKSSFGQADEMNISKFTSFSITHEEKWGLGKYVCSSNITNHTNQLGIRVLKIELNSGDTIFVKFKAS